ncbi:MAG: 16S rRNA (cytosine(1402)-N(4))-methyltransferase RsmH [Firmicutes bacterium]|nr:16S rRNA (cytosine(1402)-N(4))-methyltransferase RsmH [Bacillota bacterium]
MNYHVPILKDTIMSFLSPVSSKIYFDGTLGGGGHSHEILKQGANLIATDLDTNAIKHSEKLFSNYQGKFTLVHDNFKNIINILDELKVNKIDGALVDLGISSHQIDTPERGFSYMHDGPLDMRMNPKGKLNAKDVVNEYSENELLKILYEYGEEKFARRIVNNIIKERKNGVISTSGQLAKIISNSVPSHLSKGHPAKKTFQALRIEVNGELDGLKQAIEDIISVLKVGGIFCVLSFHSLEDRIMKQEFKRLAENCICDKKLPYCVCSNKATVKILTPKGIKAGEEETQNNTRAKSATLRVVQKISELN